MKKFLVTLMVIVSALCLMSLVACNDPTSEPIHEHSYTESVVAPTCTTAGYTLHTCECGDKYSDTEVSALGHNYVDGICSVCNAIDPESEHDHDYSAVVVDPTCEEQGYTSHTCSICGLNYKDEYVDALDHEYGPWMITKQASCTEKGVAIRVCQRDNTHIETRLIKMVDHTPGEEVIENEVAVTCTEDGGYEIAIYCTECNEELSREVVIIDALGHDYGDWELVTEASCSQEGLEIRICANDPDHIEQNVIEKLPHTPGDPVAENIVEATCESEGSYDSVIYCTVCEEEISRELVEVEKLPHEYNSNLLVEPTCKSVGYIVHVCTVCKYNYVEEVAKLAHSYVIDETSITVIDESTLSFSATCSECGEETEFTATLAEVIEPTCINEGYDKYEYSYGSDNEFVEELHVNTTEPTHKHLVGYLEDGSKLELCVMGVEDYIIDEDIQYFIDNGTIDFNAGLEPVNPGESKLAVFDCQVCGRLIVVKLTKAEEVEAE